jgi:phosphoglycerate dehydrogenase-like enzyme
MPLDREGNGMKLALLDDYLGVALDMADWQRLAPRLEVTSFKETIKDQDALVQTLLPFDAVMCMRERSALPRSGIERLPNLRLIITTGMWNASIDIEGAAAERGILVCGRGTGTSVLVNPCAAARWPFSASAISDGRLPVSAR